MSRLISLALFVVMLTSSCSYAKMDDPLSKVEGIWQGAMAIPNGPTLNIGLEIFKKADHSWGANVASLDQGMRYMAVKKVELTNNVLNVVLAAGGVSISGAVSESGDSIDGAFKQGKASFKLPLKKVAAMKEPARPQTPAEKQDYHASEVRIENKKGNVWLSGTLTAPSKAGKYPAVLLIAGSGANPRDAYMAGHRPFLVIADYLTKQGFAVLRFDKRGVYKSSGDFASASVKDLYSDVEASYNFMKNHPLVKADEIHVIGHSEGSMLAAMLGNKHEAKSIISLAGPGMNVMDLLVLQDQMKPKMRGASEEDLKIIGDFSREFYTTALKTEGEANRQKALQGLYANLSGQKETVLKKWIRPVGTLSVSNAARDGFTVLLKQNALKHWSKVKSPTFIVGGGKDRIVPADKNTQTIADVLKSNGTDFDLKVYPELNHMMQTANKGGSSEYGSISETFNVEVLKDIAKWLKNHSK